MKLWTFLFAMPAAPLASARVAAPTKDKACALLGEAIEMDLGFVPYARPSRGVICQFAGECDMAEPAIVQMVSR